MPIEAAVNQQKRYDLKSTAQAMILLVTFYFLTIGLTYDLAGFTYKSLDKSCAKIFCIFLTGVCTK